MNAAAHSLESVFCRAFRDALQDDKVGAPLKEAASHRRMREWTEAMTNVVVETCRQMDWTCCARWNPNQALPRVQKEYLTLDVTAFPATRTGWQLPCAAMELENNASKAKIAYCLWKLCAVSVQFRCLFCYRETAEEYAALLAYLRDTVLRAFTAEERDGLRGPLLLCVGTRADASSFPHGFFRWWRINLNTCNFEVI
jgi:hypothetical protein